MHPNTHLPAAKMHGAGSTVGDPVDVAGFMEPLEALTGHSTGEDGRATFASWREAWSRRIHLCTGSSGYTHIYIHACIYITCIRIYAQDRVDIHTYTYMHAYTLHAYVYMHRIEWIYTHIHTCMHIHYMHTYICTGSSGCTHIYIHTCIYITCIRIYIHLYIHACKAGRRGRYRGFQDRIHVSMRCAHTCMCWGSMKRLLCVYFVWTHPFC
jgi:hypothetical protein